MKKRLFSLLSIVLIGSCIGLSGCGSSKSDSSNNDKTTKSASTSTAPDANNSSTTPTAPAKTYEPSAAAEKYATHPFLELWSAREDVPYLAEYSSIPKIIPYIAKNNTNGGCVIICPGGGYVQLAIDKEGKAPAEAFNENNITAFVLQYRTNYTYEAVLTDVFRAIRYVRANAEEFAIDPDKISIMGFSAGGHLAAMSLEHYDEDTQNADDIDKVSAKPDFGILCYPVISLKDDLTHELTRQTFLGKDNVSNEELIKKYSAEEGVTKDTPPVFIWHCEPDAAVPVENSENFAKALDKNGIDYEMHIFKTGAHGLGLATDNEEVKEWFPDCVKWLKGYGY